MKSFILAALPCMRAHGLRYLQGSQVGLYGHVTQSKTVEARTRSQFRFRHDP